MRLVDNASRAWRWFSVQILTALTLIPMVWVALPPESQALIPEAYRPWVVTVVALAGLVGRFVKQEDKQ